MNFEATPDNLKKVIKEQIGIFKYLQNNRLMPNCLMLGIEVVRILNDGKIFKETSDGVFYDNMKVFIDPDHNASINVAYSPFIGGNAGKIIIPNG